MKSAVLYDRLERALIALEYALADAKSSHGAGREIEFRGFQKSQNALQTAGEELHETLLALRFAALQDAAALAQQLS